MHFCKTRNYKGLKVKAFPGRLRAHSRITPGFQFQVNLLRKAEGLKGSREQALGKVRIRAPALQSLAGLLQASLQANRSSTTDLSLRNTAVVRCGPWLSSPGAHKRPKSLHVLLPPPWHQALTSAPEREPDRATCQEDCSPFQSGK